MSLPSRSTRMRSDRSWGAGFLARGYLPLLALVDTAYGRAVAEETREETPGESLPLFGRLETTIDADRMTRVTSPQTEVLPRVLALAWRSVTVSAHRRAALCAAGDFDSEPQTGRERPRVWNAEVFPGPSRGSLTSWLPVWQPPTLPSAKIAWCRSRGRAAPAFHARPSRDRVWSCARRRPGLGAARRPRVCTCAASGLDGACAQLRDLHLRDGQEECGHAHRR